ncbi:TraR/DksA C4-type zinc finger protein [Texcoconibacillus texcoconensis]|uniref:YteA family regulatory protein n=1 Tax=Texcoconibacillus texcoconensis TaxID=1095777 RepID=A0A840QLB5_9BACI|nr:TraR/DksA C4-type zinc finger protein [Texcoconibacillus texcoconensis]MBB5172153.1 YteA family regulatory protein [Texcoconibacillus texcoconensis]
MTSLEKIRHELESERDRLQSSLEEERNWRKERSLSDATGELSQYDNHPADSGTEIYERAKDDALRHRMQHELQKVEAALERMDNGTYGYCVITGEPIPIERLEANPVANTLVDAEESTKVANDRPVEEDVLGGFGRYNYDTDDRETQFDAEDSYQAVAVWNTADGINEIEAVEIADEFIGYVEEIEAFVSTDMDGYRGADSVQFQRNEHYKEYVNQSLERIFQEGEDE